MKRSNLDHNFREPTRQSIVAILLIIWKTYRVIIGQIWPFLILFLFKGKGPGGSNHLLLFVIGAAVLVMIYSIINYFRYYFYVDTDELVIESGVLKRSKLNVPFDRIQTINFEQNIIHRLFNVVRLKVDTAGSSQAEFEFHAIDNQKADELRELLLSKKKSAQPSLRIEVGQDLPVNKKYKTIMQLSITDLIKAGAVENHLRSGGIILAGMWWVWQSIDDSGLIDINDKVEETVAQQLSSGLMITLILIGLFMILSFIVSMAKMIITNYDLKFLRSDNGFKINGGLFTKKDTSALDHKIQVISWGDNPLKKLIGIKDLRLKQASSVVLNKKTSIKIPSCTKEHIDLVTHTLYGPNALDGIEYQKIDKRYFYRNGGRLTLIIIAICAVLIYVEAFAQAIILAIIGVLMVVSIYLSFRKKRYGFNEEMLVVRGGTYGDKTEILPLYKIQSLSKKQTPYQSRKDLATLLINTASGKVGIPYINEKAAQNLMDTFLYKVEKDKRKWM